MTLFPLTLPPEWVTQQHLQPFYLWRLGQLTQGVVVVPFLCLIASHLLLRRSDLTNTSLTGPIPEGWANFTSLTYLYVNIYAL